MMKRDLGKAETLERAKKQRDVELEALVCIHSELSIYYVYFCSILQKGSLYRLVATNINAGEKR
jgi:hypothetical protein